MEEKDKRLSVQPTEQGSDNDFVRRVAEQKYEFGFSTDVDTEVIEKGLNE